MPNHDIFVVGASSGGVEALERLVSQLPSTFPGTLFVVLHISGRSKSFLPQLLAKAGKLPVCHAEDGAATEAGHIYVAPPDHHVVVERDHMHLSLGPKEQHQRPSINVTFRTAALAYGQRVTGVLLSGELDDGTAGLWELKRRGGIVVVQKPEEAPFPSMPLSALREVEADYVIRIGDMGDFLCRLAAGKGEYKRTEAEGASMQPQLTDLTCPDCRGTIWEVARGNGKEYRCRVGHSFSPKTMLSEHFAAQEKALYAAIVALEEGASLAKRLAGDFEEATGERLREEANERHVQAGTLREILKERSSFSLD